MCHVQINEKWEENQVGKEETLAAKLAVRDSLSRKRGALDKMFNLKHYVESKNIIKRIILKWLLEPFFEEFNKNMSDTISADGIFYYPWVSLKKDKDQYV